MNNLKLRISTKILDFVEGLPRFRKGIISSLQNIRARQKKWSSEEFAQRKAPNDSNIELSHVTLIIPFEHEEFNSVIKGLKKYFASDNENIQKFVKSLKESTDKLHASNWHNLGNIAREQGVYIPDTVIDDNLPLSIEDVSLSFYRILPSVACIIFNFRLYGSVSKELRKIQNQIYLGPVEFKKLWPLRSLHRSYTMGSGNDLAIKFLNDEKNLLREKIESWLKKGFGWNTQSIHTSSYIDVYKISGNPINIDDRREWLNNNSGWLHEYGIDVNAFETLEGKDFLVSKPRSIDQKYVLSNVVLKFDSNNESEFEDFIGDKVNSIAVSATIFGVIKKYRNKIEILRGNGFKNLYKRKNINRENQYNIQELKASIVVVSRLEHEICQSKHWIAQSISGVGELTSLRRKEIVSLGKNTIDQANYELKQIKEAATIIDSGMTNYLSVQSIYVMYKLQNRMFALTIVVTIATILGVMSGWDNLKPLVENWIKIFLNVFSIFT